jgi:hypothetical protein
MECGGLLAQLAHIAQHGDAPALRPGSARASTAKAARIAAGLAL